MAERPWFGRTFKSCQLAEIGRPLMTALYLDLATH